MSGPGSRGQAGVEASSQVDVAGAAGLACGHDSRMPGAATAAGLLRRDAGELRSAPAEEWAGNSGSLGAERARRRTIPGGRDRPAAEGKLASAAERSRTVQQAAHRGAAHDHAESLVSPSRAAVGVFAYARRACAGDLR